jgi:hypothetical protein
MVLHQCIRPRFGAMLRTIMEIRAHPILLATMPLRAISGVSSRMRREDQFSISSLSLADLGGEGLRGSHRVCGNHRHVGKLTRLPLPASST